MSEDPAATATPPAPAAPEPAATGDEPLGEAGEKALEAFKTRARAAEAKVKELEPLAQQARDAEEANKSELEKVASQRDRLKAEADQNAAENLRLRVALEKKLPAELIDRLKGDSKEEIAADADELLKLVKPSETADFTPGPRQPVPEQKKPDEAHNELLLQLSGRGGSNP